MKFKLVRGNQKPQIRLQIDFFFLVTMSLGNVCAAIGFSEGEGKKQSPLSVLNQSLQRGTSKYIKRHRADSAHKDLKHIVFITGPPEQ